MKNTFNGVSLLHAYSLSTPDTLRVKKTEYRCVVIRLNSKLCYETDGMNITTVRGDVVFIPRGVSYSARPIGGSNEYILIRFQTEEDGEWEVMHVDDIGEAKALHAELCRALIFNDRRNKMRALSCFYRLLSITSEGSTEERYLPSRKLSMIQPALDYIETDIFFPSFRVGELHERAGLSDVYFRELFAAHTGTTPQHYVTEKRLDRANELIAEGVYSRIKDVAALVGYTDPLYFSRIYKKRYGHSPRLTKKNGR